MALKREVHHLSIIMNHDIRVIGETFMTENMDYIIHGYNGFICETMTMNTKGTGFNPMYL